LTVNCLNVNLADLRLFGITRSSLLDVICLSNKFSTSKLAPECPDVNNYKWRLSPVWHRMLYSCYHVATVGVKGLKSTVKSKRVHVYRYKYQDTVTPEYW